MLARSQPAEFRRNIINALKWRRDWPGHSIETRIGMAAKGFASFMPGQNKVMPSFGTPEDVVKNARSYTGQYLKPLLKNAARKLKAAE